MIVPFHFKNWHTLDGHSEEEFIDGYVQILGFAPDDAREYAAAVLPMLRGEVDFLD